MHVKKIQCFLMLTVLLFSGCKRKKVTQDRLCSRVDLEQITKIIPTNSEDIYLLAENSIALMNHAIAKIDTISAQERTYANTLLVYEQAYFQFFMHQQILKLLAELSPDSSVQTAANVALLDLNEYAHTMLKRNVTLAQAMAEYEKHGKDPYRSIKPVNFFLQNKLKQSKREGMHLSVAQRAELLELEKTINHLIGKFCSNVVYDRRYLIASRQDLQGVPKNFLAGLCKDDHGNYIVPVNAKNYQILMQNCQNAHTRKDYYLLFHQMGYPNNETLLSELQQKLSYMANMLGYDDFATYQLDGMMAKNLKKTEGFLWSMIKELHEQNDATFISLVKQLPAGVTLTHDKKIQPWDYEFLCSWYKDKHFNINDQEIARYFELNQVLPVLLQQLSKFFYVTFERQHDFQVWADDVMCYRVRSLKHQAVLGYLFFDLTPRFAKREADPYSFAFIPAIRDDCSIPCVGASVLVANFVPNEHGQTLLTFKNLKTLMYQLGCALHTLFGATRFTEFSGAQVTYDFERVPGQVLSLWLQQPAFLQSISSHIGTGQSLSRGMIEQLIEREKFEQNQSMLQELFLSLISLNFFEQSRGDTHAWIEKIYKKVFRHIAYVPENYFEMSFLSLLDLNHGTAFYAKPWSQVLAWDLFEQIKQQGIFNHEIGMQYVTEILSPGGSKYPSEMVKKFLGRGFSKKAFLEAV
jgi:thimet oligopeptidase